ncbi:MAG: hypothetical protein RMK52_08485 [Chitinophagales bacterium]|nr:hypothetical protein [Chitinophagales bacterium]MDW8394263.1 hypothetical protein [Chitinophagales bacterium]
MSALLLALALPGKGQLLDERPRKDLQCTHAEVLKQVDLLVSTRSFGEYRTMAMWSQQLSSDQIMRRRYPMEGGYLYVAIVSAPQGIDALALEIRNSYGEKIEYVTKITELDNYLINHFFTPPDDDIYQFNVRVINRNSNRSCVCLVLMKGEEDPDP